MTKRRMTSSSLTATPRSTGSSPASDFAIGRCRDLFLRLREEFEFCLVDLSAGYKLNENWEVGVDISNLLDDEHWQSFGGDLLSRRALGYVAFGW